MKGRFYFRQRQDHNYPIFGLMDWQVYVNAFMDGLQAASWYEWLAVAAGIVSVWFSRKENIWVYPTGLINTVIYVYISARANLPGEASVNLYYSIMSVYGWWLWSRKDQMNRVVLHVTKSTEREWGQQLIFFVSCYIVIFAALVWLRKNFAPDAIPWADALASASAYTGMWLMARKKVESWYWWIITNVASIPLYFVKGYMVTSVYYFILLIMAISGLVSWMALSRKRATN